jgi:hypothetical protein
MTPAPSNTMSTKEAALGDLFSAKPLIAVPIVWLLAIVPLIYDSGGLFLSPGLLFALAVSLWAITIWLIAIVCMAIRRCWRYSLSIAVTLPAFILVSVVTLIFGEEIRFQRMRPLYLIQVACLHPENGKPKQLAWWWSGGSGWDESLVYDEADTDAPGPGQRAKLVVTGQCPVQVSLMGDHFYLKRIECNDRASERRAIEAGAALGRQLDQQKPAVEEPCHE